MPKPESEIPNIFTIFKIMKSVEEHLGHPMWEGNPEEILKRLATERPLLFLKFYCTIQARDISKPSELPAEPSEEDAPSIARGLLKAIPQEKAQEPISSYKSYFDNTPREPDFVDRKDKLRAFIWHGKLHDVVVVRHTPDNRFNVPFTVQSILKSTSDAFSLYSKYLNGRTALVFHRFLYQTAKLQTVPIVEDGLWISVRTSDKVALIQLQSDASDNDWAIIFRKEVTWQEAFAYIHHAVEDKKAPDHILLETKEEISNWLRSHCIGKFTINDDLTVDVNGPVDLSKHNLTAFPIRFGRVTGTFDCSGNKLTSLKGSPRVVDGIFHCDFNKLTNLIDGPEEVAGDYGCSDNAITTLVGISHNIRSLTCSSNQLTSLEGCPSNLPDGFDCSNNKLGTLDGGPAFVGTRYECNTTNITSLECIPPLPVNLARFDCGNNSLVSLKGCPSHVDTSFECENNKLTSLRYAPKGVGHGSVIKGNPLFMSVDKYSKSLLETVNNLLQSGTYPEVYEHVLTLDALLDKRYNGLTLAEVHEMVNVIGAGKTPPFLKEPARAFGLWKIAQGSPPASPT